METANKEYAFLWQWRKYLLLLAILVATVTYVAGLNPPGGVWLDAEDGHLDGDPVLPVTHSQRYVVFFYCNATAFMASLVIIILLLDKNISGNRAGLAVLRGVMVLDLLGLMGAYAAGSCRDAVTSIYVSVLVVAVFAYVAVHILVASLAILPVKWLRTMLEGLDKKFEDLLKKGEVTNSDPADQPSADDLQERRKFLMLLAIFATSITYVAGLSPPGGFWPDSQDGHRAGDPVLHDRHTRRFQSFFFCNATAFVASVVIIMLLLSRRLSERIIRSHALNVCVVVELFGLMGAYAAGSCRATNTTIYVISLVGAVLAYLVLLVVIGIAAADANKNGLKRLLTMRGLYVEQENRRITNEPEPVQTDGRDTKPSPSTSNTQAESPANGTASDDDQDGHDALEKSRSLLLLLATLVATVTYQAGLNPPGGAWPDERNGHRVGDPVLLETHTKRYKVFFYCNATAFVASLVIIIMVQSRSLSSGVVLKRRPLLAVLILDLFALKGAYSAGSCRDVVTSFYVSALAVAVFVYVMIHVVVYTILVPKVWKQWAQGKVHKLLEKMHIGNGEGSSTPDLEKRRKFLLLLAILAATVTYQAGLTPPGGFWSDNNESHHAGDPILLDNYPQRYKVFFYCNATSFMASIAVIILLVSQRLYAQGIQCYAIRVCVVVALFGLMGAYAAGSCRRVRTSIYVFALVAAVLAFVVLQILLFVFARLVVLPNLRFPTPQWLLKFFQTFSPEADRRRGSNSRDMIEQHTKRKRKYLMLLGILAASVTYQAGLSPPGGMWSDDNNGHVAGNPVLLYSDKTRYHAFYYCNATSFVASIVVIILLLQRTIKRYNVPLWAMQTAMVLDLLGLLGAYAAGSCREWETSGYVVALVIAVLIYIAILVLLSFEKVATKAAMVWKCCVQSSDQPSQGQAQGRGDLCSDEVPV